MRAKWISSESESENVRMTDRESVREIKRSFDSLCVNEGDPPRPPDGHGDPYLSIIFSPTYSNVEFQLTGSAFAALATLGGGGGGGGGGMGGEERV